MLSPVALEHYTQSLCSISKSNQKTIRIEIFHHVLLIFPGCANSMHLVMRYDPNTISIIQSKKIIDIAKSLGCHYEIILKSQCINQNRNTYTQNTLNWKIEIELMGCMLDIVWILHNIKLCTCWTKLANKQNTCRNRSNKIASSINRSIEISWIQRCSIIIGCRWSVCAENVHKSHKGNCMGHANTCRTIDVRFRFYLQVCKGGVDTFDKFHWFTSFG